MTLIIAGIYRSEDGEFGDNHGFCVSDGMSSEGAGKPFTLDKVKMHVLVPRRKCYSSQGGWSADEPLPRLLIALAGNVASSVQIREKFASYLEQLYVSWADEKPIMKLVTKASDRQSLPEDEHLPHRHELPLLEADFAAAILGKAICDTLTEIVSTDDLNAEERFRNARCDALLFATDTGDPGFALYKLIPRLGAGKLDVVPTKVPHGCAIIGSSQKVRTCLAKWLPRIAQKKDYQPDDLCLVTLLKIAQKASRERHRGPGALEGVGGIVRSINFERGGGIEEDEFDPTDWQRRAPHKRDRNFFDNLRKQFPF